MIGAIAGDIIGSVYEWNNIKITEFPLFSDESTFTDDTVLTAAIAHAILDKLDYSQTLKEYGRKYPHAGYGDSFLKWLFSSGNEPYNSWGNGSAMRVSAVGWAFNSIEEVLSEAKKSAAVTHNHPEGIKGAQAVALAIFLARNGTSKKEIKREIESRFDYNLNRTLSEIRLTYQFDVSCQGSVPESIIAFLESNDYENAVRLAVSIGGDSDTIACITGSIAEAFYKQIPAGILSEVKERLPVEIWQVIERFRSFVEFNPEKFLADESNLGKWYQAYLKTDYTIRDKAVDLTLRIGEKNSAMDELLGKHRAGSAAFLTAYNPYSKELSSAENESRQERLVSILKENDYRFFYGFGQGESDDWSPEPSVLVLGIDLRRSIELGRQFEQNAVVYFEKGDTPRLFCTK